MLPLRGYQECPFPYCEVDPAYTMGKGDVNPALLLVVRRFGPMSNCAVRFARSCMPLMDDGNTCVGAAVKRRRTRKQTARCQPRSADQYPGVTMFVPCVTHSHLQPHTGSNQMPAEQRGLAPRCLHFKIDTTLLSIHRVPSRTTAPHRPQQAVAIQLHLRTRTACRRQRANSHRYYATDKGFHISRLCQVADA